MKSIIWKNLVVLVFILSIGCYVAYRVGAFDGIFKDKNAEKNKAELNKISKEELKEINSKFVDLLLSDSKSSPFMENETESSKGTKSNKTRARSNKKDLMPGPKSAEVINLDEETIPEEEKEVFEKPKLNMPAPIQKNSSDQGKKNNSDDLIPSSKTGKIFSPAKKDKE